MVVWYVRSVFSRRVCVSQGFTLCVVQDYVYSFRDWIEYSGEVSARDTQEKIQVYKCHTSRGLPYSSRATGRGLP